MNYKNSIKFVDDLFRSFIIFILSLIWTKFFIDSLLLSILLSCIITLLISFGLITLSKQKQAKNLKQVATQKDIEKTANYLLLSNREEIMLHLNTKINGDILNDFIIKDNAIFVVCFDTDVFRLNDFYAILKNLPEDKTEINILAISIDPKVTMLAQKLASKQIEFYNAKSIFEDYFAPNPPDTSNLILPAKKIDLKTFFSLFTRPDSAKGYLFCSLYVLIFTLFVPYKIYYLIFSTILLTLALISNSRRRLA